MKKSKLKDRISWGLKIFGFIVQIAKLGLTIYSLWPFN